MCSNAQRTYALPPLSAKTRLVIDCEQTGWQRGLAYTTQCPAIELLAGVLDDADVGRCVCLLAGTTRCQMRR